MVQLAPLKRLLENLYVADYAGFTVLLLAYIWIQFGIEPYHRMFALDDLYIQYPFAEHERVPVSMMFIYAGGVPLVVLVAVFAVSRPGWHKAHVSILGLFISLILTSFITDVVKNTVGRPRPDLLARCKPRDGLEQHALLTIEVCTQTNRALLDEGWRSFPSGHSSFSFSGLGYLALFIAGQLHIFRPRADLGRVLLGLVPIMGALLIAISRLEDYRHDVFDVTVGSSLGMTIAYFTYRRYYPSLGSSRCHLPYLKQSNDSRNEFGKHHDLEEGHERGGSSYERIPLQDR